MIGLGWRNDLLDISAERITMDESISNTIGDETYSIVEMSVKPIQKTTLYADYFEADRIRVKTFRTDLNCDYGDHTVFTLEYSKNRYDDKADIDSIDVRVAMSFDGIARVKFSVARLKGSTFGVGEFHSRNKSAHDERSYCVRLITYWHGCLAHLVA